MQKAEIYVYGSCHFYEKKEGEQPLGDGGYGAVVVVNGELQLELCGGSFPNTTNARMDMTAIIEAADTIKEPSDITVYVSNDNILKAFNLNWIERWRKENFRERKHRDLWLQLNSTVTEGKHTFAFVDSKTISKNQYLKQATLLAKNSSYKYKEIV